MCDITRHNFSDNLEPIVNAIKKSSFVSFDTEFSALNVNDDSRSSLFDDGEARYRKLHQTATKSIITQVGLSIFTFDDATMVYTVKTFNFYVCPRTCSSLDPKFICQASSCEFLARHNFDFNKLFHDGISYLNHSQESELRADLETGALLRPTERNVSYGEEDFIKQTCSKIALKLSSDKNDDDIGIVMEEDVTSLSAPVRYVLHQEIRNRFKTVWTNEQGNRLIVSLKSKDETKDALAEKLVQEMVGFSAVIQAIVQSKKPIVGHNCLLDLMRIYHQFVDNLPESYAQFKLELHRNLPQIYDTKNMAFELKRQLEDCAGNHQKAIQALSSTNLQDVYKTVYGPDRGFAVMYSPKIKEEDGGEKYGNKTALHEAGYDAYLCGVCFVHLAHIAAGINYLSLNAMKPLRFSEHLRCVQEFRNQINIGRASIHFINLEGKDSQSVRPDVLYIKTKSSNDFLQPLLIAELLSRYGSVDVRPLTKRGALVAVASHKTVRDILLAFKAHPRFNVTNYSMWRHDRRIHLAMLFCGSAALIIGILSYSGNTRCCEM